MKNYKNIEEIKNSTQQSRGEVFNASDLDLIWINGQRSQYMDEYDKPYIIEEFDETKRNTVELTVYDMDDNQLFWNVLPGPIRSYNTIQPNTVVLSPGDDLRSNGFTRGQYRVSYEFYRDVLGSNKGDKLYIEDISPSRREIRVRPVKTADIVKNATFNNLVVDFSDNGITKTQFKSAISVGMTSTNRNEVIHDKKSTGYTLLTVNKLAELKAVTRRVIIRNTNSYERDVLNLDDQGWIINNSLPAIMDEVFTEVSSVGIEKFKWSQTPGYVEIAAAWRESLFTFIYVDHYSGNVDYYINFGNGNTCSVINWLRDNKTYPEEPYSIVFKLYEPLSKDIKEKQQLWVSRQITRPIIEKVFLLGFETEFEDGVVLRPTNFDINVAGLTGRETGYQTWTDLISTQPSTSQAILDHFMSASNDGDISLNIDYGDYSNFIHFGSAEERLKNFKYKLELIENYGVNIGKLNTYVASTNSTYVSQSRAGFRTKIRQVKNGFDSYEKHLYYTSGSQYSGSLTSNDTTLVNAINEWPKKNKKYPYVVYETTSSNAKNWYADQLAITQRFDTDNIYNFRNNLPAYITTDENNEDYLNFMYMVGQHFDTIFTYIKQLTNISNRDESLYEGLAKDLTYHVASSHGFDLFNGNDNAELWRWAFGYDQYGTYHTGSVSGSGEDWLPYGDISKEIWRRLLNNMPYIMKTKGSERSIKALLSCYGIPTSLLTIREYGGPDPRDYDDIQDKSAWIFEDFVYAIDFEASQSVTSTWGVLTGSNYPHTIEFRAASAPTYNNPSSSVGLGDAKPTQSIVAADDWSINLINSGSGFGFFQFAINDGAQEWSMKTDRYRYYDNEFNSVMLRYSSSAGADDTLELWTKKAEGDTVVFYSSASLSMSAEMSGNFFAASTLYIGGETTVTNWGQNFTGSIQEFKMYQTALSESIWTNHVRWPKSYNSNTPKNTYTDLQLRYSFDDPKNHSSDATVTDVKANQHYTNVGTANNFDNSINYTPRTEEFAALSPNIGGGRFINNKIRIENNELISTLSPRQRSELGAYDRSPNDSPKLGIYFSPLDAINKDIIATFAGIDLAGEMGDPRDRFEDNYRDLKELQWEYWKKYTDRPQFNDYIRVIKQYDQSFFNQLKALIPARAKPVIGVLIEPNILERYKVKWYPVTKERNDYEANSIYPTNYVTQSWEKYDFDTTIKLAYSSASEYILYEAEVDMDLQGSSSYYVGEQQFIPMVLPIQDTQTGSFEIRRVYTHVTSSVAANGATTYSRLVSWTEADGTKRYSSYYDVYDLNQHSWILEFRELQYNMWYGGTLNTIETTFDGKEPVEITYTNPNKLKATNTGPSRIIVE